MERKTMMSSLEDVARLAGVSTTTVSRALRDSPMVREVTRARVRAVADELGFVPSKAAASLATGRSGRIALLIGEPFRTWFSGSVIDGLYQPLRDAGYDLVVYRIRDEGERTAFFDGLPATRNADALIVSSFLLTPLEQRRLRLMQMPIVYLNQHIEGEASVAIDDVEGAQIATRHLLDLGHRELAYVRGAPVENFTWSSRDRYKGFCEVLSNEGLQESAFISETVDESFGQRVLSRLLSSSPRPTGIVVEEDGLAVQLSVAIWQLGLRIPEDFSLVGFDNDAYAGTFGLTTISQPIGLMTRQVAAIALELASDSQRDRPAVTVPVALVLRKTTRGLSPAV